MIVFVSQIIRSKYLHLILFFSILVADFSYNFLNLNELSKISEEKIRYGITIVTNDDLTYLRPAINLVDTFELKDGSLGVQKYFYRPPGYALFLSIFYFLFGLKKGLFAIVITQTIFHALSIALLFDLMLKIKWISIKFSFIIFMILGIIPFTGSFLFYTLTEGLTPFLIVLYFYSLFFTSSKNWILSCISFSLLILTRPVFFFLILPLVYKILTVRKGVWIKIKLLALNFLFIFFPMIIWQLRSTIIAGEYPGLYPIYYKSANNIYRPTHQAIWNFAKSWGVKGDDFHKAIGEIWEEQIKTDKITDDNNLDSFFKLMPDCIYQLIEKNEIINAFHLYKKSIIEQKKYYDKDLPIPEKGISYEDKTIKLFDNFKLKYRASFPISYYILTPVNYLKQIVFHSNLSLYIFQHTFRGVKFVEFLRYFCFLLHTTLFLFIPLTVWFSKNKLLVFMNIAIGLYVFFLAFYYRELEERYTLPILLPLFFSAIYTIKKITQKTKSFSNL